MHRLIDDIQADVSIPLIHIADPTADAVRAKQLDTVGLLGTRYTMEGDFYKRRLEEHHGPGVLIPDEPDRSDIHDIIYGELVVGKVRAESRRRYQKVILDLVGRGAQGIILGCTEIGLLIGSDDAPVPIFDTTHLHAQAAVAAALS
jgi:aspartate racemase